MKKNNTTNKTSGIEYSRNYKIADDTNKQRDAKCFDVFKKESVNYTTQTQQKAIHYVAI